MADRHTPLVEQAALADFLREGHLERHIRRMRRLYKRRRDALLEALDRHFGRRAAVRGDAAGLHLTVRFSGAGNLRTRAERNGVSLSSSEIYYSRLLPNEFDEFILGFSAETERTLREGIKKIAPGH
jgi:GntR family transcriptional regulator/MocR family aminotransferase